MNALELKNVTKQYGQSVKALQGISLSVKQGEFFGLLGKNGAGKTTTIGIITGLVNKTSGSVHVFGKSIDSHHDHIKRSIGVVPQEVNLAPFERVYDIVVVQAGYHGIPRKVAEKRTEKYLKQLKLWDKRSKYTRQLSGGMKRRLMIARALVTEPTLFMLDEPTAGVDVELRLETYEYLRKLNAQGKTIILTTHYLEEAETLCNRIAIINNGVISDITTTKEIGTKLNDEVFVLEVKGSVDITACKGFNMKPLDDDTLEVTVPNSKTLTELFRCLEKQNVHVKGLRAKQNRLERLFLEKTGGAQ